MSNANRRRPRWLERLSFTVSLVTVASVAVFVGWLMGQYAIQWVTSSPRSLSNADIRSFEEKLESAVPQRTAAAQDVRATSPAPVPTSAASSPRVPSPAAPSSQQASSATLPSATSQPAAPSNSGSTASAPSRATGTASAGAANAAATAAPSGAGTDIVYRVQVGAFRQREGADRMRDQLVAAGFEAFVVPGDLYRVQVGAFREEAGARRLVQQLAEAGFEAVLVR